MLTCKQYISTISKLKLAKGFSQIIPGSFLSFTNILGNIFKIFVFSGKFSDNIFNQFYRTLLEGRVRNILILFPTR